MTSLYLHHAFIDEAGSVALSSHSHFLIVAALCTDDPRAIDRLVRKVQKKYGSPLSSGELKAKQASDKLTITLLEALAQEAVEIFVMIIDHRQLDPSDQAEAVYRWATSRLVRKLAERFPRIEITLDRRYTNEHLRNLLEVAIRERLADLPHQVVLIRQEDSRHVKELQAVDFIAWAFYQKYERGNHQFYDCIAPCIVEEELLTRKVAQRK
jgi:hypothetical protein